MGGDPALATALPTLVATSALIQGRGAGPTGIHTH